jgi:hypothetical protein
VHFSENLNVPRLACLLVIAGLPWSGILADAAGADPTTDPIAELLDAAEAAERDDHLIYPAKGSAMSLYHEVLFLDPDNAYAVEGLTRLAEQHLEAAQAALDRNQLLKADSLVSKARMIYPEYPAVAAMQRKIDLLENASRTRVTLDWRLVADRSPALTGDLERLGGLAKAGDCRVTINVSNDAEGRWIYRTMNQAAGDGRLRAEVKIASPAAVEVVCFDGPPDAA